MGGRDGREPFYILQSHCSWIHLYWPALLKWQWAPTVFEIVGTTRVCHRTPDKTLFNNVSEANQVSMSVSVKQSQNNKMTVTAGGAKSPQNRRYGRHKVARQVNIIPGQTLTYLRKTDRGWLVVNIIWTGNAINHQYSRGKSVWDSTSTTCIRCCWTDCSCREQSESLIPGRRRRKSVWQHPTTPDTQRLERQKSK